MAGRQLQGFFRFGIQGDSIYGQWMPDGIEKIRKD